MNWDKLLNRSYTPYSQKPAACIIEGTSGQFYPGVRIENVSFPLTIAEDQAAICFCLSQGDQPARLIVHPDDHKDHSYWINLYNLPADRLKNISSINFQNVLLSSDIDKKSELKELTKKSVTPNSNFHVSALLGTSGGFISGINVEFDNWQSGLCAERLALAKAYAFGYNTFDSIHIHADAGEFVSPCGACRQVLIEHLPHHPVNLYHFNGSHSIYFSDQLLPFYIKTDTLRT
ncbi:MAG: hypothetical protein WD037_06415 [Balneolales bacterium]